MDGEGVESGHRGVLGVFPAKNKGEGREHS
jgi:hypothetical protein